MLNLFRNKPEKQGNAGYAKTLFRIFTIEEARGLHLETADALAGLLNETPLKNLMKLDEE